ncbi:hypothetical protein, partial [Salmonella enterica]
PYFSLKNTIQSKVKQYKLSLR